MKLKGTTVIELTDVNTQEVETFVEENMVTNAVNNILGLNPMAVFYCEKDYSTGLVWTNNLLPICPNMIGGILLFPKALEENKDSIYVKSNNLPVAYASNNVNSTENMSRGSMNLTESKKLDNGYKFVWEFSASQGNGTIAALGLTSAKGGENGFGSLVADASPFLELKKVDIGNLSGEEQMLLYEVVEVDFEKDLLYSIAFEDSSIRIRKIRIPIFSIGLNEKIDDTTFTILEDKTIAASTFQFLGSKASSGEFVDGKDGYWYGFANVGNSSGDATVHWAKISKTDYSISEGTWTLSNTYLAEAGSRDAAATYPKRVGKCCMRNGYLYVPAYNNQGIYKINVSNPADVTLISFGFASAGNPLGTKGTCEVYLTLVGDLIVGSDYQITSGDAVIRTKGDTKLGPTATPLFQYKNFLLGWGGSYGSEYRTIYLLTPYLATVNNLSSAVVKTTDKTMKITYTLTEE